MVKTTIAKSSIKAATTKTTKVAKTPTKKAAGAKRGRKSTKKEVTATTVVGLSTSAANVNVTTPAITSVPADTSAAKSTIKKQRKTNAKKVKTPKTSTKKATTGAKKAATKPRGKKQPTKSKKTGRTI